MRAEYEMPREGRYPVLTEKLRRLRAYADGKLRRLVLHTSGVQLVYKIRLDRWRFGLL